VKYRGEARAAADDDAAADDAANDSDDKDSSKAAASLPLLPATAPPEFHIDKPYPLPLKLAFKLRK
jgi:hypothetical protein